jgi:hypothetical protein
MVLESNVYCVSWCYSGFTVVCRSSVSVLAVGSLNTLFGVSDSDGDGV